MTVELDLAEPRVEQICSNLGLSEEATEKAEGFAHRADMEHPINRSGRVIAAAAVYAAGLLVNEKRTQGEVGEAAADGVSKVAIREAYMEILECEGYSTPDDHATETSKDGGASTELGVVDRVLGALRSQR